MTFPVTPTSHLLSEVRARGGYQTLQRVLTSMTPEQVTKEVTRGRHPRPWRRGVPGWAQMGGHTAERRPAALSMLQR